MSIESHLAELKRKHLALKQEIENELRHANANDMRVVELKRRKLHIKDEITRLGSSPETLH
ncbi:hypothetical protein GCM10007276_15090 [Agaricicola taiwanensis]|uniref:DUF465 domain-containing protein n=1 Tax=Agaricicola taiwanensis TaxID=591372 RepID=A0A8J2VQF0_9RHOB|nr:DUF465 domain-containing protein [Agaricicola taiwanensis]GGE38764.1 hypothetical protein GCM10007276_15090 [Agaricicola taiwanensis]